MLRSLMLGFLVLLGTFVATPSWAQRSRSPLISEITANRHGLTRPWFAQVDMDTTRDRVQSVSLRGGMLIVQTRRGVIQALDAETGRSLWVKNVGSPSHPTTEVGSSDVFVAVMNGSTLYLFDRKTGDLTWKHRTIHPPGAGPAISKTHVFVPTVGGHIEAYNLTDLRKPPWLHNSGGRAMVQPVVTKNSISWPTNQGLFYVAGIDPPAIRFRTEARDQIVAQAASEGAYLYVASLDGYVYKVHENNGSIAWRFSTGEAVIHRPVAIEGRVYITAQHGGLYCVLADEKIARKALASAEAADEKPGDARPAKSKPFPVEEGGQLWWSPGIVKLLAVSPSHVYGLTKAGKIAVVRADTGKRVGLLPTHDLSIGLINHVSDRIYLGTELGLIQCLHETGLKKPVRYVAGDDVAEGKRAGGAADKPDEDAGGGEGGDLFGGDDPPADDGGDDPFGGDDVDADDGDAGGDDAGDDDDPFG